MLDGKWMLLLFSLLTACSMHTQNLRTKSPIESKSFWLKQDFHAAGFYDDGRYRLLSEVPPDTLRLLKSPLGNWITPPPADETIKNGTRVTVQKVERASELDLPTRPLMTPRHLTWIYLTVAMDAGFVKMNREKTYILIVPEDVVSDRDLEVWFAKYFSADNINWNRLEKKLL